MKVLAWLIHSINLAEPAHRTGKQLFVTKQSLGFSRLHGKAHDA